MEKLTHYVTLVILNVIFTISSTRSKDLLCGRNSECYCLKNGDHNEYQCPPDNVKFLIHAYPNTENPKLEIDCLGNKEFDKTLLPHNAVYEHITRLDVRYCPLPPEGFLSVAEHFGIKKLDNLKFISGFLNSTIPETAFANLSSVTSLVLRSDSITNIDNKVFKIFSNLTSLSMENNKIKLNSNIFLYLANLQDLDLKNNDIEEIPSNLFLNLNSLINLDLWKNAIRKIEDRTFEGLNNLKFLEVSYNKIDHIGDRAFENFSQLMNISLKYNKLLNISRDIFRHNEMLDRVELTGNSDLNLTDNVFSNFTHLKHVSLVNCNLQFLPSLLFQGSSNLITIRLENNKLVELPKDIFKGLENLKNLNVSNNKLEVLNDLTFSSLKSLEILSLRQNNLKVIGEYVFKHIANVKEIDLSYNQISEVRLEAFLFNKVLKKIDMSHNKYSFKRDMYGTVSPFNKNEYLEYIDLSHNKIMDFPSDLMFHIHMKEIKLNNNNISVLEVNDLWKISYNELRVNLENNNISRTDFSAVEQTAESQGNLNARDYAGGSTVVLLENNPLICDCFAYDLVRYIQNQMTPEVKTAINLNTDLVKCFGPSIFKGLPIGQVPQSKLICSISDVLRYKYKCTDENTCECYFRPFDSSVIFDCSSKNFSVIPDLHLPENIPYNQTEVNLQNNNLKRSPSSYNKGFENVTKLYLNNNQIQNISWVPSLIEVLSLDRNFIQTLDYDILRTLNSSGIKTLQLGSNPWKCDCSTKNLTEFLRYSLHEFQVDTSYIRCNESGKLLIDLNKTDLCKSNTELIWITATIIIITFCAMFLFAAFYYKYQQEIKVWLYAKGWCLCLVQEEELDKDKIYDAFVSFSHKDEEFVTENLLPILEGGPDPYNLCLHYRHFIPGEFIAQQVINSVRDSRRTIVILSKNFLESVWGKLEFRTAHVQAMSEKRVRVIVVLYGDVDIESLDDEMKAYLKTNTYVKWGDAWFWDKLKYALPHSKSKLKLSKQKHANMMKYLDDKFSLVRSNPTPDPGSTPPSTIETKHPFEQGLVTQEPRETEFSK